MRCIALVTAVALGATGCSFVLTRGPGSVGNPPRSYPDCTTAMTWPVIDGVFGGLMLAAALGAGLSENTSGQDETSAVVSTVLVGAAFAAGAYVGYTRVSRCRSTREQFQAAYPGYNPQYPYPAQPPNPYPQQQPPYPYPAQQPYPPAQQPYPPAPQPYPPAQAQPRPQPPAPRPQPPAPRPQPPAPPPPASALGTEGDVCVATSECATGLACSGNVCIRPAPRRR